MNKKQVTDLVTQINALDNYFWVIAVPFGNAAVVYGSYRGHSLAILWGKSSIENADAHGFMSAAERAGASVLAAETLHQCVVAAKAIATAINARYNAVENQRTWNLINSNGNPTGH